ncbi:hypothetical protein QBC40DRAFT_84156 [Triangularia verruculosa]|uniref:Uncharacterized protein n=1 Tax=Triangularia verruculosa TaxID=2587418 RepID=A0AAN6XUG0_9PEZI|nr:hypothetical protein QBC40DRAFT_84156 [Triangularia verruculosa]
MDHDSQLIAVNPDIHSQQQTPTHDRNQDASEAAASTTANSTPNPDASTPEVPAAFPKRRRGRPPGRPNMSTRETEFKDHPLVKNWNAACANPKNPIVAIAIAIRDALSETALKHENQRKIFRLPSHEYIHFVQGWITARHIAAQRPSYVNGLLIHSRGQDAPVSCTTCAERRSKHSLGPFLECRVLPEFFHGSCSNCKWFDNTSNCSLYKGPKPNRKRKAKEDQPALTAPEDGEAASTETIQNQMVVTQQHPHGQPGGQSGDHIHPQLMGTAPNMHAGYPVQSHMAGQQTTDAQFTLSEEGQGSSGSGDGEAEREGSGSGDGDSDDVDMQVSRNLGAFVQ